MIIKPIKKDIKGKKGELEMSVFIFSKDVIGSKESEFDDFLGKFRINL